MAEARANFGSDPRPAKGTAILEVQDLYVSFKHVLGRVRAVNGVSFKVKEGRVLGIVGESGCGKSVTALSILRLISSPPGNIDHGSMFLRRKEGTVDLAKLAPTDRLLRSIRGNEVSMIFQEPMRSLHPMFPVGEQVIEGLLEHTDLSRTTALGEAVGLLDSVGLSHPDTLLKQYPHQLSGGIRQRVMIAIALACRPRLLIADEPTTALDVTIQAQVLELIEKLRTSRGMSIMLISHDLGVIAEMADDVLVMYLGRGVEYGHIDDIFYNPLHPYTRKLLKSVPSLTSVPKTKMEFLEGVVPELFEVPRGCVFADRCDQVLGRCRTESPPLVEVTSAHQTECWLYV